MEPRVPANRIKRDASSRLPLEDTDSSLPDELRQVVAEVQGALASRQGGYVELTARSCFSFLRGGSQPESMVRTAHALGYDALAITDFGGLYGIVRAWEEAKRVGMRLIVGAELEVVCASSTRARLVVLVENHAGYRNLCHLLTVAHAGRRPWTREGQARGVVAGQVPDPELSLEALTGHTAGLFFLLCESPDPPQVGRRIGSPDPPQVGQRADPSASGVIAKQLQALGARLWLAIAFRKDGRDRQRFARVTDLARRLALPIVATGDVRFATRADKEIYDVLQCVREKIPLSRAGRRLLPNTEARLKSEEEMQRAFAQHPEWLAESRRIADACRFSMSELEIRFPSVAGSTAGGTAHGITGSTAGGTAHGITGSAAGGTQKDAGSAAEQDPNVCLRERTYAGMQGRYPHGVPAKVQQQVERELALIAEIDVAPYFLSVADIVAIARAKNILCQGRGSAANSAVCYCLGITAVDPARSNLLFDRFLSADRHEPPDIDVDFEHERREEVIQAIYEKYGRDRAAMVCEVIAYRARSAIRDVAKVYGLDDEQAGRLAKSVSDGYKGFVDLGNEGASLKDAKRRDGAPSSLDSRSAVNERIVAMARRLVGIPRHLSIHVGGFVLSALPLCEVAPVEPASMPDRTVIPWDKDDLDTLGFFKLDVLGLGMLSALRRTLKLVHDARDAEGEDVDPNVLLARIPPEDPAVYEALGRADTVGVFQIESRAQMSMLPRLLPKTFYDLVVEVAIVRPGPIQGGMVHPYLRRRTGQEKIESPHPCLEPILARTLGVPLFQEQVMQIAITGAGYTGGEADQLRRDMAAWRRSGNLEGHRERLARGFAARGIAPEWSERLFAQIHGFAEYGFPESHSASFALLVYASAWLKVHHPAAFTAALVNSLPMGFYSASTLLEDAKRHGVTLLPIDVNHSEWDCTLGADLMNNPVTTDERSMHDAPKTLDPTERTKVGPLRVGLARVKGLSEALAQRIVRARPFTSLEDFVARTGTPKDVLEALAEAGALDSIMPAGATPRRAALYRARAPRVTGDAELFAGTTLDATTPALPMLRAHEQLTLDYERTGLSVDLHPLAVLRPTLPRTILRSDRLRRLRPGRTVEVAGMVICRQRPATASGVVFFTLEDERGFVNLVVWERVYERLRGVLNSAQLLHIHGKLQASGGAHEKEHAVLHIVVDRAHALAFPSSMGELPAMSRDFH